MEVGFFVNDPEKEPRHLPRLGPGYQILGSIPDSVEEKGNVILSQPGILGRIFVDHAPKGYERI